MTIADKPPLPVRTLPAEIDDVQTRFTALLRTPLSSAGGRFTTTTSGFDQQLVSQVRDDAHADARQRLAVYQRQYWLRLFSALQQQLPLTARLIGMFAFNRLAQQYLLAHPPAQQDLGHVGDRFATFLSATPAAFAHMAQHGVSVPKAALQQSVTIDLAWHAVWRAPLAARWQPSVTEASELARRRLQMNATAALIDEDWPLVDLRQQLHSQLEREHVPLPKRLAQTRHWLVMRAEQSIVSLRIEPKQALLYRVCASDCLDAAITRLQLGSSRQERDGLPARVQQWLSQSMSLGLWSGSENP